MRILKRAPSWSFGPQKRGENKEQTALQYIKARNERLEEKANSVLEKMGTDRKKYMINPVESYNKVIKHSSLPLLFRKSYDFKNTEQYKAAQEKRNFETPAPNSYWDDGKSKVKLRKNLDDSQAQKWIMSRDKTFKRVHISGMRKGVF